MNLNQQFNELINMFPDWVNNLDMMYNHIIYEFKEDGLQYCKFMRKSFKTSVYSVNFNDNIGNYLKGYVIPRKDISNNLGYLPIIFEAEDDSFSHSGRMLNSKSLLMSQVKSHFNIADIQKSSYTESLRNYSKTFNSPLTNVSIVPIIGTINQISFIFNNKNNIFELDLLYKINIPNTINFILRSFSNSSCEYSSAKKELVPEVHQAKKSW